MPVLGLEDLPEDAHLRAVGFFGSGEHPSEGPYRTMRRPVSFSGSRFRIRRHAPRLGEHTAEVLAEAGLSPSEIEAWTAALQRCRTDEAVRVVVVTGAGSAFCSGGDIVEMGERLDQPPQRRKAELYERIQRIPLPPDRPYAIWRLRSAL